MTDDRLAFIDQATFLSWRATDRHQLAQFVWVYERPVDMERLRRFHRHVGHGFAGRLIEPSVLPFGRHRWVAALAPAGPLKMSGERPPSQLGAWIDERSQQRIDAVDGPGWHLGVLPMSDGTTAVSLVLSHCLLDGNAALRTIVDAVDGTPRDFGYRPPRSRKRLVAFASDGRQVIRDLPEFGRTVARAVRYAHSRRDQIGRGGPSRSKTVDSAADSIVLPAVSAIVDGLDWDARAGDLGGTGYSLLAGFAARLGERLGRAHPASGNVTLLIAVSDRDGEGDRRGNAMKIATATVDPATARRDLSTTRAAVRAALTAVRDVPDETHALLPLTPFVPRRAVRRTADVIFGDLPVSCSNLGDIPSAATRPDGTEADYLLLRPVDQNVSRSFVERTGGSLVLAAGRVAGKISIGVVGYATDAANDREWLAHNVIRTLADFDLKGTII